MCLATNCRLERSSTHRCTSLRRRGEGPWDTGRSSFPACWCTPVRHHSGVSCSCTRWRLHTTSDSFNNKKCKVYHSVKSPWWKKPWGWGEGWGNDPLNQDCNVNLETYQKQTKNQNKSIHTHTHTCIHKPCAHHIRTHTLKPYPHHTHEHKPCAHHTHKPYTHTQTICTSTSQT